MRSEQPTIKDITLELEEIVEPVVLECHEVLQPEAEHLDPYRVCLSCYNCGKGLRFATVASAENIRKLQALLFEIGLLCATCSVKVLSRNGS